MDHRKITVSPDDLKKLEALLREEEARVDAMSDDELEAAERELEERIRRSARHSTSEHSDFDRDANWKQLQERLRNPVERELDPLPQNVEPLRRKNNTWGWLGALAAAALALFILYPSLQPGDQSLDPSQALTKGTGNSPAAVTDCKIDVRGRTNESVTELDYSQGFEVSVGESVQIFYNCRHDGYLQVWNNGHPAEEFRNLRVQKDQNAGVLDEDAGPGQQGKLAEFPLQAGDSWIFSVVLTDSKIGNEVNLLDLKEIPEALGTSKVLWYDTITVKGRAQ